MKMFTQHRLNLFDFYKTNMSEQMRLLKFILPPYPSFCLFSALRTSSWCVALQTTDILSFFTVNPPSVHIHPSLSPSSLSECVSVLLWANQKLYQVKGFCSFVLRNETYLTINASVPSASPSFWTHIIPVQIGRIYDACVCMEIKEEVGAVLGGCISMQLAGFVSLNNV